LNQSFIPQVKHYLDGLSKELKVLLIMDNTGGHSIEINHEGVRPDFLAANTTSLIQLMGQGCICAVKAIYTGNLLQQLVQSIDADLDFSLKVY
jgi:hypothetical protein